MLRRAEAVVRRADGMLEDAPVRRLLPLLLPLAVVCACSSQDTGTLRLVTGEETDTFTQSPQPTKLTVYAVDGSGNQSTLATASLPTSNVDLGSQVETGVATVEVMGTDASGRPLVYGQSLALEYGALANGSLPIFVQRTGQFARLPSPAGDTRSAPTLAILSGEYLFVGAGSAASSATTTQIYDFASLTPLSAPPPLPRAPLSMPVVGTVGLVIDDAGAQYFDFSQDAWTDPVTPPSGFTFADVAGGQVVYVYDTASQSLTDVYVVGATRISGGATQAVLHINPSDTSNTTYLTGNLSWLKLTQPRLGAGAAWVAGRGLVVTGGSATAAGVEVFAPGSTTPTAVTEFPPDASSGAGVSAIPNDSSSVLVAGGVTPTGQSAGVRQLHLDSLTSSSWGALPLALDAASAFALQNGTQVVVVGSDVTSPSRTTHVYLVDSAKAAEVPTKVPHADARAIQSPVGPPGAILLFGGSGALESFTPAL